LDNRLRDPIVALRARSPLAYLFDMNRRSLRRFLHSRRLHRFSQSNVSVC
jgi:hypothetical protein